MMLGIITEIKPGRFCRITTSDGIRYSFVDRSKVLNVGDGVTFEEESPNSNYPQLKWVVNVAPTGEGCQTEKAYKFKKIVSKKELDRFFKMRGGD